MQVYFDISRSCYPFLHMNVLSLFLWWILQIHHIYFVDLYCFDSADMSCCELDDWHHSICDILWLLCGLVNVWIYFEYFQEYSCSSSIGRIWLQVNVLFGPNRDRIVENILIVAFLLFLKIFWARTLYLHQWQVIFCFIYIWSRTLYLYCISVIH